MPINKDKISAGAQVVSTNTKVVGGAIGTLIGGYLDPEQVNVGVMDSIGVFEAWANTWGKEVPPDTHPVRDAIFTEGRDLIHALSHEGIKGVGGMLLIVFSVSLLTKGAVEAFFARERFRNA